MKTTMTALAAVVALIALAAPRAVWADTILDFNVSGTLEDGSILSGWVAIDTTVGIPETGYVETTGHTPVGSLVEMGYSSDQPQFFEIAAQVCAPRVPCNSGFMYLFLDVPNLIGYTGGGHMRTLDGVCVNYGTFTKSGTGIQLRY